MNVGIMTVEKAVAHVKGLLEEERVEIDRAFLNSEGGLSVSIKLTIKPEGTGVSVQTDLDYYPLPKKRVSTAPEFVDENQGNIF